MLHPSVTVIICAYTQQRWDDLVTSVESVLDQPEATEIVLVIDHEDELLARARRQWPEVAVIANLYRQGLSGARNTGVERATGEIVVFLDDDAHATEGWLSHLLSGYDSADVIGVGGRAVPIWPDDRPPVTLPPELWWIVGCSYEGQPTARADVRNLMGCNMSFRRTALQQIGGFNSDMGRVGLLPLGCEETEACIRMSAVDSAARIVYEPRAVVNHRVTADRVTWGYLRRRSYGEGLSKAALVRMLGAQSALATETDYARRVLPRGVARELSTLRVRGCAGAAAIVLSFATVGFGYVRGLVTRIPASPAVESAQGLLREAS